MQQPLMLVGQRRREVVVTGIALTSHVGRVGLAHQAAAACGNKTNRSLLAVTTAHNKHSFSFAYLGTLVHSRLDLYVFLRQFRSRKALPRGVQQHSL